jgi:chromosome partitioning protein
MFTVAFIGQKGGTGKTTCCIELGVTAARAGDAVAIIDLDPQTNAANWKDRRKDSDNPAVVSAQSGRLKQTIEAAEANGADLVLIDTPGKNDNIALGAARLADLVLIPCQGSIYAMETLPAVYDIVQAAGGKPAFVVYNEVPPLGSRIADELKAMTKSYCGLEPCPVHFTRRHVYEEAPASGRAGQEIDSEGKVKAEAEKLWLFIREQVNKFRSEHGGQEKPGRAAKRA